MLSKFVRDNREIKIATGIASTNQKCASRILELICYPKKGDMPMITKLLPTCCCTRGTRGLVEKVPAWGA